MLSTQPKKPLIVDLDGTLIKTDMLLEDFLATIWMGFSHLKNCYQKLVLGRHALKSYLANAHTVDYSKLPYNEDVIRYIEQARSEGRKVYLATASNEIHAKAINDHLQIFDGYFASNEKVNLKAGNKAEKLVAEFGEGNFDYIGNSLDDLPIWRKAGKSVVVSNNSAFSKKIHAFSPDVDVINSARPGWKVFAKALRVHQWAKNILVFVPMITSQTFTAPAILASVLAFIAFSFCASAIYMMNDLADLDADRQHRTKHKRPLASGALSIQTGAILFVLLLLASFGVSSLLPVGFTLALLAYLTITTAYTFVIKRMMIADVITLSFLYTLRVLGGAVAINVQVSEWLIAFSVFIFTSLAFTKRHIELLGIIDDGKPDPANRDYRKDDVPIVSSLAAASGFSAVIVFALYISSPSVSELYDYPLILWLSCLVFIYWISRMLVLTQRRILKDDPVLFAVKDKASYICAGLIALLLILAT